LITATAIEIAKRIEIPIRAFHYTDWVGLYYIGRDNQIMAPSGKNFFTFEPFIFGASARDKLATCHTMNVGIWLNLYIN
jgi:hypothetical protein